MKRFLAPLAVPACAALTLCAPSFGSVPIAGSPAPSLHSQPGPGIGLADAKREKFRKQYRAALKVGSEKEMNKLFTQNEEESIFWILEVAYSQVLVPKQDKKDLFASLESTWKRTKKTDFPAEMRRFYDGMEGDQFKTYNKLAGEYTKMIGEYFEIRNAEGGPNLTALVEYAQKFYDKGKEFDEFRCDYYASQCYSFAAASWDKDLAKDKAQLRKACEAYGLMLEIRERIGLKDKLMVMAKPRHVQLIKAGYGPEGSAPEGGGEAAGPAPANAPADEIDSDTIPLTFQLIEDIHGFARPNYFVDEHYPLWHSFYLREVGSEVPLILRFKNMWDQSGHTISAIRDGSSKMYIDVDGDRERTEKDVDLPIKGKLLPVEVKIEVGGKPRHAAFYMQTGQSEDQYQGMQQNLEGSDTQFGIYASPGGSMVGTINGETVQVIDEDMDGVYGGKVAPYAHVGMTKGVLHPEFDSIRIGKSKKAVPFSRFLKIGGDWFDVQSVEDGTALQVGKVEIPTGSVKLKFKGPKPTFVILEGTGGLLESYFDVASGTVEVPVGEYKLLCGMVAKGKKKQLQKVLMLPGEETPTWKVVEGKTTEVLLGGPFGFDFKADIDTKGCQIIGNTVAVIGVSGERYERPWLCVPRPEASARIAGAKRGTKPEKMPQTTDTMEVSKKGWWVVWFPKDMAIDVKGTQGSLEVQLTEKKHPLFGKITSEWLPFGG